MWCGIGPFDRSGLYKLSQISSSGDFESRAIASYVMPFPFLITQEIDLHHSPYSTELGTGRFAPFLSSGPLFVFGQ